MEWPHCFIKSIGTPLKKTLSLSINGITLSSISFQRNLMQTNVVIPDELKPFLDWMISPNQIAFVEGRWINEDFVLAQEAVLTMNKTKSKQGWLGLKIDFPKAFDRMEWNFIEWIKKKKGFHSTFIHRIIQFIPTSSFSIMVNSSP